GAARAAGGHTGPATGLSGGGGDEKVTVEGTSLLNPPSGAVDGLVTAEAIQDLPLNGRNFLALAFLSPGNAPAPNFDPTKTTTVGISSAGQLGRGGNLTIDGADLNDDAVGGSIPNNSHEALQEVPIAAPRHSPPLRRAAR